MISEDSNRKWGTMKILSPGFQGLDDHKEFSVIDIVITLS